MLKDLLSILIFLVTAIVFLTGAMVVARLVAPFHPSPRKAYPYESGEQVFGEPWVRIHIRYYIFALLFLIFDIETAFLYPWAVVYRKLGLFGLVEMAIFIAILFLGLIYPWRKGVLRWIY